MHADNNGKGVEKAQVSVNKDLRLFSYREWVGQGMVYLTDRLLVLHSTCSTFCGPLNLPGRSAHAFPQIMSLQSRRHPQGSCLE